MSYMLHEMPYKEISSAGKARKCTEKCLCARPKLFCLLTYDVLAFLIPCIGIHIRISSITEYICSSCHFNK